MTFEFDPVTSDPHATAPPRRRALAVLAASMLVAGAGGIGFGLGRSAGGDATVAPSSATEEPTATDALPQTPATPVTEPVVTEVARNDDTSSDDRSNDAPEATDDVGAVSVEVSGGGGWTMFGGEPMDLLTERITDAGVVLRAHLGQLWEMEYYEHEYFGGPDGWRPPAWCFESGQVRIALGGGEATGTSVIDVGSVSWWSEPFEGRAVSALTMGTADANPYRVVFIQAPPSVSNVTVTFDDGGTDSVTPTNGVAILAVPGIGAATTPDAPWIGPPNDFDVTFDDGGGEPTTVDGARTGYNDPQYQQSCSPPPPELPEPGQQPEDPAGDEATIADLMATIYGEDDGGNDARIDDPTGVADAREQVRNGGFEEAAASAEAIVEELVFTSPTEAWFRYRIETNTGIFSERFGIAVNIDGTWKITRATICQDLAMAGGECGGDVAPIRPPAR